MKDYGFPKEFRLLKRRDFCSKWERVRRVSSEHFTIICKANGKGGPRIGMVVSRKVGNAVIRNRIKRLVREFFRLNRRKMHRSKDIIVIARPMSRIRKYGDIEEELKGLL